MIMLRMPMYGTKNMYHLICRELARELKTDVLPKLQGEGHQKSFLVQATSSTSALQ